MPELPDLSQIAPEDVSNDDLLLIYDVGSGSSLKVPKSVLLAGLAVEDGNHNFGISTINDLTAPLLETNALSFTLGGATVSVAISWAGDVVVGSISSASAKSLTATVTGAAVGDHVVLTAVQAVEQVVTFRALISAADTLTIEAINPTNGAIDPGTVSFKALVIRAA